MGVPWRDARLSYYGRYRLSEIVKCDELFAFKYGLSQVSVGLVVQTFEDPYSKGNIELCIAAPDFMTGKSYHPDRSLPLLVPHNTIYGIGTTKGDAKLDALMALPEGSTLNELIQVLFSKHAR